MARFVLVHGACHQAAHWDGVVRRLTAAGHRARAVHLPGHPDSDGKATLDDGIAATCAVIADMGEDVVLVGHSLGGMIVAGAAERMPERVRRVDFLAALVPADGESAAMIGTREGFGAHAVSVVDALGRVSVPARHAKRIFFEGMETDALASLCATDPGYLTTPVRLSAERFGRVPKRYILCLRDQAIMPDVQHALSRKWPDMTCVSLDAGHVPIVTAPDALTWLLVG